MLAYIPETRTEHNEWISRMVKQHQEELGSVNEIDPVLSIYLPSRADVRTCTDGYGYGCKSSKVSGRTRKTSKNETIPLKPREEEINPI
jgi:hypothetical protein